MFDSFFLSFCRSILNIDLVFRNRYFFHGTYKNIFLLLLFRFFFVFSNPVSNQPISGSKWFQYFPRPCRLEWGWALADRSLFHIHLPRCLKTQLIAPLPKSKRSLKVSSYSLTLSGPLLDNEKGSRLQMKKRHDKKQWWWLQTL